jgi:hypothetical protein
MAFNAKDPRFQRAAQRAFARASMTGNAARLGKLTQQHAAGQLSRQLEFGRLGLQKRASEQRFDQAEKSLDLAGRRIDLAGKGLDFRISNFEDLMKDRKRNLKFQIGLGGAGVLYSGLEGRRRAQKIEEETELKREQNKLIKEIIEKQKG